MFSECSRKRFESKAIAFPFKPEPSATLLKSFYHARNLKVRNSTYPDCDVGCAKRHSRSIKLNNQNLFKKRFFLNSAFEI
jgi:hypothetical protein